MPPLRDRADDVPLIAMHFLEAARKTSETRLKGFSNEAMAKLISYRWPGNVRELKNIVLHSFTHLGGATAPPDFARAFLERLAERLRTNGYQVWSTPFGYFCEWDLSVHGESLAKVWKEID